MDTILHRKNHNRKFLNDCMMFSMTLFWCQFSSRDHFQLWLSIMEHIQVTVLLFNNCNASHKRVWSIKEYRNYIANKYIQLFQRFLAHFSWIFSFVFCLFWVFFSPLTDVIKDKNRRIGCSIFVVYTQSPTTFVLEIGFSCEEQTIAGHIIF